jgi:hypothetical protein
MNASLRGALAASIALALGTMHDAAAVALSPNGTGQVLLFPYYTVQAGNQTLLSVVNNGQGTKAVRVRFNEARNGKSALQLNLYLPPGDSWTGALVATDADGPAQLVTFDASCTVPPVPRGELVAFRNYQFTGANLDHPESHAQQLSSPARTREGFIEMIDMGTLRSGAGPTQLADEAADPEGCAALADAWRPPNGAWFVDGDSDIDLPAGGLYGAAAIVDVGAGALLGYRADALVDFHTDATSPGALHVGPDEARPSLADAANGGGTARARVVADGLGSIEEIYPSGSSRPDAVSLVLMQDTLLNEFNADPLLASVTEWVVTFPTKRYYVDTADGASVGSPFTNAFRDDGRAREIIQRDFHDRDARPRGIVDGDCGIIGVPPPGFCEQFLAGFDNAVNVLAFGSGNAPAASPILGARFDATASLLSTRRGNGEAVANGWASVRFANDQVGGRENSMVGPTTGMTYPGLPAIGFAAIRFLNANVQPGVLATFGDAQRHRGTLEAFLIEVDSVRPASD